MIGFELTVTPHFSHRLTFQVIANTNQPFAQASCGCILPVFAYSGSPWEYLLFHSSCGWYLWDRPSILRLDDINWWSHQAVCEWLHLQHVLFHF